LDVALEIIGGQAVELGETQRPAAVAAEVRVAEARMKAKLGRMAPLIQRSPLFGLIRYFPPVACLP
jgi:hypothetical protein